jgi:excisionase family DNA binding protein
MIRESEDQVEPLAFTYRQTARTANISERMVRKLAHSGRLAVVRIGRAVRVPKREVLRLCRKGASK